MRTKDEFEFKDELARWHAEIIQGQYDYAETKGTFVILCVTILIAAIISVAPVVFRAEPKDLFSNPKAISLVVQVPFYCSGVACFLSLIFGLMSVRVARNVWSRDSTADDNKPNLLFFGSISEIKEFQTFRNLYINVVSKERLLDYLLENIFLQSSWLAKKFFWLHCSIWFGVVAVILLLVSLLLSALCW